MRKILFLGQGSANDPGFEGVEIDGRPYGKYMSERGIQVLDRVVESCHGCHDLMSEYSEQLQDCIENGDRVVGVLEGGLLFGLPSIQATQTTFPIISVPMDYVSYTGFMVPSGHAVVAGVGVDRGDNIQKIKALKLAERVLNLGFPYVNIVSDKTGERKLFDELKLLGVRDVKRAYRDSEELKILYGDDRINMVPKSGVLVWADSKVDLNNWKSLEEIENHHHLPEYNYIPGAQVKGLKNLAMFAAKIISLQDPSIREKIREVQMKKLASYDKRDLRRELGE
ncbi:hypothetical protein GOV12_02445 [Candidatus Pacearchaeota archaeon]|nr:hypothetical protein [Candidatus Pacearchaeota archaeon]